MGHIDIDVQFDKPNGILLKLDVLCMIVLDNRYVLRRSKKWRRHNLDENEIEQNIIQLQCSEKWKIKKNCVKNLCLPVNVGVSQSCNNN